MSRDPDWDVAISGTDRQWFNLTGHCGGCGTDTCHPGTPCTAGDDGCRYCPDRGGDLAPPVKSAPAEPDPNQLELFGPTEQDPKA